ncbi:MAG: hypothetical protein NDJ18_04570 [candidate division Zixibacteria bacterium]|nr:hypothetical protein [candidate division Zixibacteria bacterium]
MTTPRISTIPSFPRLTLQRLDSLIDGYLTTLLEHTDEVKLADFTKLVELRHRIKPEETPSAGPQQFADAARGDEIPLDDPIERRGEEPQA